MNKKSLYSILIYFGSFILIDLIKFIFPMNTFTQAMTNLIVFPFILVIIIYLLKDEIKQPLFNKMKSSILKTVLIVLVGFVMVIIGQSLIVFLEVTVFHFQNINNKTDNLLKALPVLMIIESVIGPIVEELIFRRILLGSLHKKFTIIISIVLSSIIFAGWHLTFFGFLQIFWLSIIVSVCYYYTNRLVVPISIHILYNFLVAISLFV